MMKKFVMNGKTNTGPTGQNNEDMSTGNNQTRRVNNGIKSYAGVGKINIIGKRGVN